MSQKLSVHWGYVTWFMFVHASVPIAIWYGIEGYMTVGPITSTFNTNTLWFAAVLYIFVHLSITCGAHRLFTHRAYKATPFVQWLWLVGFSGAIQGTCIWWVGKHWRHHAESDTDGDPHNINKGFWWAHMKWLFFKESIKQESSKYTKGVLRGDVGKRLLVQHRLYWPLAISVGLVFPTLACWLLWNDPLGGFLIAGLSRLVYQYHTTWLANSWSHMFGARRFKGGTATGSPIVGLLFNVGESTQHDYHHARPRDWRLGPKLSLCDPGGWVLRALGILGLVSDFQESSAQQIEAVRV